MSKKQTGNNFLVHGSILALASVLVRFIGMLYRIPMVNIIGQEGNGYYSTAYSVYTILLLLSSYSLPLAVSKMVSARISVRRWLETKRILTVAFTFAVIVGLIFAMITYFGADWFCDKIMNSPMSAIPLRWMAPTVFIMTILGVLRGFFQGMQTTIPTAVSQILEQIVNALVSVGMAALLFQHGKEVNASLNAVGYEYSWGAAGGTIGTGAGALTALIFCFVVFFWYRPNFLKNVRRDRHPSVKSYGRLMRILVSTAVPVILSTACYNCIDIIDTALFNAAMRSQGMAVRDYSAIWGNYNSAYLLLIHLPVAFSSAIASALIPSLTQAFVKNDREEMMKKISLTVSVTLLIAIPCAFALTVVGGNLAKLLFPSISEEAGKYLIVGSLAVVFFSVSTVTNAILQGLDHMKKPVAHALTSLLIHVAILGLLLFVFKAGIYSVIVSYMIFGLVMSLLNLRSVYKISGYLPHPVRNITVPAGASLVMTVVCFLISLLFRHVGSTSVRNLLIIGCSLFFGALIYFVIVLLFGALSRSQIVELPAGRKILKIAEKLHLVR